MKLYFGTPGWGWRMYGIGWKTKWFLGLSIRAEHRQQSGIDIDACKAPHANY